MNLLWNVKVVCLTRTPYANLRGEMEFWIREWQKGKKDTITEVRL